MHRISYILYNYSDDFRPEDFYIIGSNRILLNYITGGVLPELDVYGIRQMTMEQLFIRLLYEEWDERKYRFHLLEKDDEKNAQKGNREWFHDLELYCAAYEQREISHEEVYLENTKTLLVGHVLINTYLREHPDLSMQSKILMLNEVLYSKYENEVLGKQISYPAKVKKALDKKYASFFGDGKWKTSIYDFYREFLQVQAVAGKEVDIPETSFDVYDLAALAYIYKRIKETDPVREASHVVIDEAQDFGMMAYCCLHYCLRGCTYTIMGDTSQNIHFRYGLNDWEELRKLVLTGKRQKCRHNQEFAMETLTKAKEYEKVSLTQKETREENRAIGIQEMDERNSHGPKRIVIKPEQIPGRAPGNTSTTGTAVMPKSSTGMRKAAAETGKKLPQRRCSSVRRKEFLLSLPVPPTVERQAAKHRAADRRLQEYSQKKPNRQST